MKKEVVVGLLAGFMILGVGCGTQEEAPEASVYKDGVYEGVGEGLQEGLRVSVIIEQGKIGGIEIVAHKESPGVADPAFQKIPAAIIEKQSTEVDVISGVTYTSEGIIEAVNEALSQAK